MQLSTQIAKHFRDVHFGGNWTCSNLRDNLAGLSWQQATAKPGSLNSIATLVCHLNYYVSITLKVFEGESLIGNDKLSFILPPINNQQDWENLVNKTLTEAEQFAKQIELLPDNKFFEDFADAKYGNYYRNISGMIEHCHYHLGQIALIRKMMEESEKNK